jgi:pyruvate-formate lyase-activating enzyme
LCGSCGGYACTDLVCEVARLTDLLLFDIKHLDEMRKGR